MLDPWTQEYLAGLGVGQGWQCLELGSGNGSIAEWLCAAVGRLGSVTAVDVNPVLLELYFRLFFAEVRDRVVDSGRLDAATLDAASTLLHDPSYWTQCWMMTAVWARKPGPGPEQATRDVDLHGSAQTPPGPRSRSHQ